VYSSGDIEFDCGDELKVVIAEKECMEEAEARGLLHKKQSFKLCCMT
jgi:hypothetical protein